MWIFWMRVIITEHFSWILIMMLLFVYAMHHCNLNILKTVVYG
jgi:hypothetical protein